MTAKPACARLCATPAPITPAPTTPTVRISIAPPLGCTHAPVRPGLYLGCGKDAEKRQPDRSLALLWQLPMTDSESPPPAVLAPFGHPIVRALLFVVAAVAFEFGLGALFEGTLGPALENLLATSGDQLLLFRALELPFEIAFALLFVRWLDRRALATPGLAAPSSGARPPRDARIPGALAGRDRSPGRPRGPRPLPPDGARRLRGARSARARAALPRVPRPGRDRGAARPWSPLQPIARALPAGRRGGRDLASLRPPPRRQPGIHHRRRAQHLPRRLSARGPARTDRQPLGADPRPRHLELRGRRAPLCPHLRARDLPPAGRAAPGFGGNYGRRLWSGS